MGDAQPQGGGTALPWRKRENTCARSLGQLETGRIRDPFLLKTRRAMETFSVPSSTRGRLNSSPCGPHKSTSCPQNLRPLHGEEDFARGIKEWIWRQEIIRA